jgi:predicted transposase/invertase (TIGR01784 family)
MSYHRRDILWKGTVEKLAVHFLRFFYKDADKIFDFTKGFKFFNTELAELNPDMDFNSPKRTDILMQVYTKDGNIQWVLVHLEVQGYLDEQFAERVYICHYRLRDRYKVPVTTLVIYLGKQNNKNISVYLNEYLGTKVRFDFNAYYVGEQSEEELRRNRNPFAAIILIALLDLKGKRKPKHELLAAKINLARNSLKNIDSPDELRTQIAFLRLYIKFQIKELNTNFDSALKILAGKKPEIMDTLEMIKYIELQDAREEGERKSLLATAKKMFKEGLDISMIHKCTGLSVKELNALSKKQH